MTTAAVTETRPNPYLYGMSPSTFHRKSIKQITSALARKKYPTAWLEDKIYLTRRKRRPTVGTRRAEFYKVTPELVTKWIFEGFTPVKIVDWGEQRETENPEMAQVFSQMKEAGWDEAKFRASGHAVYYSSLIGFCKFATDDQIEELCPSK